MRLQGFGFHIFRPALYIYLGRQSFHLKIMQKPSHILRYAVSIVASAGLLSFIAWHTCVVSQAADQIKMVPFDSASTLAYQISSEQQKSYRDLAILLLAGLWGFCVVKKEQRLNREDWPEWLLFISATAAFAFVFFCKYRYDTVLELSSWRAAGFKMNVDFVRSPYIEVYRSGEIASFFLALILSALTVLSSVYFRPSRDNGGLHL
jgi:hypothetical protein